MDPETRGLSGQQGSLNDYGLERTEEQVTGLQAFEDLASLFPIVFHTFCFHSANPLFKHTISSWCFITKSDLSVTHPLFVSLSIFYCYFLCP